MQSSKMGESFDTSQLNPDSSQTSKQSANNDIKIMGD